MKTTTRTNHSILLSKEDLVSLLRKAGLSIPENCEISLGDWSMDLQVLQESSSSPSPLRIDWEEFSEDEVCYEPVDVSFSRGRNYDKLAKGFFVERGGAPAEVQDPDLRDPYPPRRSPAVNIENDLRDRYAAARWGTSPDSSWRDDYDK